MIRSKPTPIKISIPAEMLAKALSECFAKGVIARLESQKQNKKGQAG